MIPMNSVGLTSMIQMRCYMELELLKDVLQVISALIVLSLALIAKMEVALPWRTVVYAMLAILVSHVMKSAPIIRSVLTVHLLVSANTVESVIMSTEAVLVLLVSRVNSVKMDVILAAGVIIVKKDAR